MFDTVLGLPVHALVVHAVVVLLPLMALVTAVWAFRPRASRLVGRAVVAANVLVVALTFTARFSGEELQARLSLPGQTPVAADHAEVAQLLPFFALALLFASVLVAGLRVGGVVAPWHLPGILTAVVALAAVGWTLWAGHSGSEAVWGDIVRQTGR